MKPEWGTKRTCLECSTKFYDMKRAEIICPKCEKPYVEPTKPRRAKPAPKPVEPPKTKTAVNDDEINLEIDDDDNVIEEAPDLNDDDEDVAVAVVVKPVDDDKDV
jgi:uncharacterized protein (TIGR02300 family)